jgi:TPR repeat protein
MTYQKLLTAVIALFFLGIVSSAQSEEFLTTLEQARLGDTNAQNGVGIMYSEAKGVRPNQRKAVYWFRRSAEGGYSIGTCNPGLHYSRGWGVPRNKTLMMKYVFAAHALDGLKCNPADYITMFRPSECQVEQGWELAVAWLRNHPEFKNSFGDRPWMADDGEYPVTRRESGGSFDLPAKSSGKCNRGGQRKTRR